MLKWRNEIETPDYKLLYHETMEQLTQLSRECSELKSELYAIKPVLENGKIKPAVSKHCRECVYCVRSDWDGSILGCCKDIVCEDFKAIGDD